MATLKKFTANLSRSVAFDGEKIRETEKKSPEDAQALAQEYAEWLDDSHEDMGFMYMARLSELLD